MRGKFSRGVNGREGEGYRSNALQRLDEATTWSEEFLERLLNKVADHARSLHTSAQSPVANFFTR
jgi:hypothetical protein